MQGDTNRLTRRYGIAVAKLWSDIYRKTNRKWKKIVLGDGHE